MKITDRFIGDHKTFRKLIRDLAEIGQQPAQNWDAKRLIRLVELFKDHLLLHAWGEETFYYPALKAALPEAGAPMRKADMDRLDAEHRAVDVLMDQLETQVKQSPPDPGWTETYRLFERGLSAHMDEEEKTLFPLSEERLGVAALHEISDELERRRREAPPIRRHSAF